MKDMPVIRPGAVEQVSCLANKRVRIPKVVLDLNSLLALFQNGLLSGDGRRTRQSRIWRGDVDRAEGPKVVLCKDRQRAPPHVMTRRYLRPVAARRNGDLVSLAEFRQPAVGATDPLRKRADRRCPNGFI
jgi:hypothetical protein